MKFYVSDTEKKPLKFRVQERVNDMLKKRLINSSFFFCPCLSYPLGGFGYNIFMDLPAFKKPELPALEAIKSGTCAIQQECWVFLSFCELFMEDRLQPQ